MTDDLVERIARAMWERSHDEPWSEAHHSPVARQIYLDDARAAIAAMPGWQPIETAPKDGSQFLAWWSASKIYDCVDWTAEHWQNVDGEVSPPTHWMPLPDPPQ